ncbi:MAG TPA: hypothetical protein VHA11_14970 [Bryobacteraceae bacterium]|nr:hypothetical protein [Bryobacteraceae bacterium]
MGRRVEPFALMLHRRHSGGESVADLAAEFRIPQERIEQRLRVASIFAERQALRSGMTALNNRLRSTEHD